ncbi:unnamed protein product [Prorocentrum cordatum]|uniref:RRM domain-containing protein n=1 Tax=Prorocentrum cordatum TaxID=2364126 RepID=A0ABN9XT92_9DINO|nr:unnamed protein product [Polarella glacialis]
MLGGGAKTTPAGDKLLAPDPREQAAEVKDSDESESDEEVAAWAWVKAPAASGAADAGAAGAAAAQAARAATAEVLAVRAARAAHGPPPRQPGPQPALQQGLALQLGHRAARADLAAQNAAVLAQAQAQAQALAAQQALQAPAAPGPVVPGPQAAVAAAAQATVLVLHGMFKAAQVNLATHPAFFDEIHMDVAQECSRFGSVLSVWVDRASDQGDVWVHFLDAQSASNCRTALDGRWFAGIQVGAEFSSEVALAQRMAAATATPASNQGSTATRVGTWT